MTLNAIDVFIFNDYFVKAINNVDMISSMSLVYYTLSTCYNISNINTLATGEHKSVYSQLIVC